MAKTCMPIRETRRKYKVCTKSSLALRSPTGILPSFRSMPNLYP